MILYFSGTGNSLAIARTIAEHVGDKVMPLREAVQADLSQEKRIGLIYPSYWFNAPRAVTEIVPRLQLLKEAYIFIVIPCGAQAGNSIHTVQRQLADKGLKLAYSQKIRVPTIVRSASGVTPTNKYGSSKSMPNV